MKTLISKISFFILFLLISGNIIAQDNTLYNMSNVPQSMNNNPAFHPKYKAFVGFPAMSNVYFDMVHTGFTYKDLFKPLAPVNGVNQWGLDLDNMLSTMKDKNYINTDFQYSLLNLGFMLRNDWYLSFSINTKVNERFKYPKLLDVINGNFREDGTPLSFSFAEDLTVYNEFGVGFSKKIDNKLYIGGKIKFLRGVGNIHAKNMTIDMYTETNPDSIYNLTFDTDFDIMTASPVEFNPTYDSQTNAWTGYDYDLEKIGLMDIIGKNKGLGFDFGATYNINDMFTVSASIIDLGFIKWSNNINSISQKGEYYVNGIDLAKYIEDYNSAKNTNTGVLDDFGKTISDTIVGLMEPKIGGDAYKTRLSTKLFLGGSYHATKWLDASALYRGYFYSGDLKSALTLSANANFLRAWSASVSWSAMYGQYNNVGVGFAYNLGIFQFYFVQDNIAATLYPVDMKMTETWIKNTKQLTYHFGVNMVFRYKKDIGLIENSKY